MPNKSALLFIWAYRLVSILLLPLVCIVLLYRALNGKEEISRILERFGIPSVMRPTCTRMLWIHAASVGESVAGLALLQILGKLSEERYTVLFTTNTVTAAKIVKARKMGNVIHQYFPLDIWVVLNIFMKYWRPNIAYIIESELWPNVIYTAAQFECKLVLINARLGDKSYSRWWRFKWLIAFILSHFEKILCQSATDQFKYKLLGGKVALNVGNLKYLSPKLSVDTSFYDKIKSMTYGKSIVLLASSHKGDEEMLCNVFNKIKEHPVLLIIAPRHPSRRDEIIDTMALYNISYKVRSIGEIVTYDTDVYLVDVIGEMGTLFALSEITIIGGSFHHGGHNVIEPAHYSAAIICGPSMSNFMEITMDFLHSEAYVRVSDEDELLEKLKWLLKNKANITNYAHNARKVLLQKQTEVEANYMRELII